MAISYRASLEVLYVYMFVTRGFLGWLLRICKKGVMANIVMGGREKEIEREEVITRRVEKEGKGVKTYDG